MKRVFILNYSKQTLNEIKKGTWVTNTIEITDRDEIELYQKIQTTYSTEKIEVTDTDEINF